jgi:2-polyprenyl-3-methyl-5-hydroxy-6-metoxy-1,4-benzoquinol methylase
MNTCRVCGRKLPPEVLLRFDGMPAKAQHLPGADDLAADAGVTLDVRRCAGCGLVQLTNPPVPYFREVIRAAAFSPEMGAFRRVQFAEWLQKYGLAGKKVIEIGCGRGEYLELMKEVGADARGLEFNREAAEFARRNGLAVETGYLETGDETLEGAPFDGFFILNWLEHLPNIADVLRGIGHNLAPGAIGLVEVPNFDLVIREKLFTEFTGDHLFYFSAETLARTLGLGGFEVLDCRVVWHDYIISATVRKREPLDLSAFAARRESLERELAAFIARHRSVAVWGAGHQALAVMALAKLAGKIRYVVDSAPFKQGKFTPATHLPIVPPATLRSDPPRAVIVMAASYSDEVVGMLRRDFDPGLVVAVLRENGLETVTP